MTESPSHKHYSTEFFQMWDPCPTNFVCTHLSRYHEQNRSISLPGPDYLAPDFPLMFAVLDLPPSLSFKMCISLFGHVGGEILSELIF